MTKSTVPGEVPAIPEEMPVPEKLPDIAPTIDPENPTIPEEDPGALPVIEPFQPEIPNEIPPSVQ